MTLMDDLCRFIWLRPGLDATGVEWRECLGETAWHQLPKKLFVRGDVGAVCRRANHDRAFRVAPHGNDYQLVCETTGYVEATGVAEADVRTYRLNPTAFGKIVRKALSIVAEPGSVAGAPRAFPIGEWRLVDTVALPTFLILPPTTQLLMAEVQRLLVEITGGFVLLVPQRPTLSTHVREQLERKQAMVIPLPEVMEWDGARFAATDGWEKYRDAYCKKHMADRMVTAEPDYQFIKKGMWAIRFAGKETLLESTLKGPIFIRYLLERQGQEIHVARMLADIAGEERLDRASDAGELVDKETLEQCSKRYDELQDERADAERDHPDRLPEIDAEITQLANYFAQCVGLSGKSRKASDDVAKIRKRITRNIETAYEKIEENDPQLASHLRKSIKTHTFMSYEPESPLNWNFE